MGIIYLVQPCELVGTDRYKIGMSNQTSLNRLKSYKNGSRYLCFFEVPHPYKVEKLIKYEFNKHYKLIAGREYFQSDNEKDMIQLFIKTVFADKQPIDLNEHKLVEPVKNWMNKFSYNSSSKIH